MKDEKEGCAGVSYMPTRCIKRKCSGSKYFTTLTEMWMSNV